MVLGEREREGDEQRGDKRDTYAVYIPPRWISIYTYIKWYMTPGQLSPDIYVLQQQLSFTGVHPERDACFERVECQS